eukprot:scaffold3026_cov1196-Pavlova_lutheri.AAC.1
MHPTGRCECTALGSSACMPSCPRQHWLRHSWLARGNQAMRQWMRKRRSRPRDELTWPNSTLPCLPASAQMLDTQKSGSENLAFHQLEPHWRAGGKKRHASMLQPAHPYEMPYPP